MGVGSDAAGALHKKRRITGIATPQDDLDAAEHLPRTPGIDDLAAGDLDLDS